MVIQDFPTSLVYLEQDGDRLRRESFAGSEMVEGVAETVHPREEVQNQGRSGPGFRGESDDLG